MLRDVRIVRWVTPDVRATIDRFRDRLAFQVEETESERAVVRFRNAAIWIASSDGIAGPTRLRGAPRWEHLELESEDDPDEDRAQDRDEQRADEVPRPVHPNGAAELAAIGWTTVDHERAVAERESVRYVFAGIDSLLGAGAWLSTGGVSPAALLLEPSREGPIAAALARNGEAPAALYVRVRARRWEALAGELARRGAALRGPVSSALGDAYLVRPDRPWGPFLLFVRVPSAGGDAGDLGPTRDAG
jgi:hypothetical protein